MKIPKARLLSSGRWFIQLRIDGKSVSGTFDSEEEAVIWATSMKQTLRSGKKSYTDYEKLIKGLSRSNDEIPKSLRSLPTVAKELEIIDKMDGFNFEKYCANLFMMSGYFNGGRIHTTRGSGDYGADLIIDCLDGTRVAVQCKRMNSNVGVRAIQEIVASKSHYHAVAAAVITNAHFTSSAKDLAYTNGVTLFDRKYLIKLIDIKINELNRIWNKNQWEELILDLGYLSKKNKHKPANEMHFEIL